jgi:phage/plasmid-associated DNA primase
VLSFVSECCEVKKGTETGSTRLFDLYKKYCDESGMKPYSQRKFVSMLTEAFPETERGTDKTGKRRIIRNISITDNLG